MADDFDGAALVAAARQHDESAAREIVRRLYPLVVRLVRSHRPRRTAEEDLCQMIFAKVFQKLSQFSGKVPLEHWGLAHRGQHLHQPDSGRACAAGIPLWAL
jgi:RNA polymerase sigma-70 factor (ECF subfamily)